MSSGKTSAIPNPRKLAHGLQIAFGIAFLILLAIPFRDMILNGRNDFSAFYAGAKLARTEALYQHNAIFPIVRTGWPDAPSQEVFLRAPFYAVLLSPLAELPYRAALALFTALTLACFLWFVVRFSKECPELAILAAFSIPMYFNINGGADVPFLLPCIGGFILLSRRGRDFAAGLLLALCAIKFHLFVFIPLLLLFKKRWRTLLGASAGTIILTLIGGVSLLVPWLKVMFSPLITEMPIWKWCPAPNIHGLVTVLGGNSKIEFALVALVATFFVWACARVRDFEVLLAVSLICGLLVSFHNFAYDDLLLMPVLVLVTPFRLLRNLIGLALTPIAYFALFAGGLYAAILPLMLFAFLGSVWFLNRVPADRTAALPIAPALKPESV